MIGWFIIGAYVVLAVALWPWGLLAGAAHALVLLACIPRNPKPTDPPTPTKRPDAQIANLAQAPTRRTRPQRLPPTVCT